MQQQATFFSVVHDMFFGGGTYPHLVNPLLGSDQRVFFGEQC